MYYLLVNVRLSSIDVERDVAKPIGERKRLTIVAQRAKPVSHPH